MVWKIELQTNARTEMEKTLRHLIVSHIITLSENMIDVTNC